MSIPQRSDTVQPAVYAPAAFRRGFRDLLPLSPGILAWGLVTGVAMVQSGLGMREALGMTLATYAGSAQLAALPLIAGAAPVWVVFATAFVVNLRFVIYALGLRRIFAGAGPGTRLGLGYLTGDIGYVKLVTLLEHEPSLAHPLAYFAGTAACNWLAWQVGSVAGLFAAGAIPPDSGLDLAGTLALLTLVVPLCTRVPALGGVLSAACVSVLAHSLPLRLGLLAAVAAGVAVAVLLESRARRSNLR